jgi:hypothetical protein
MLSLSRDRELDDGETDTYLMELGSSYICWRESNNRLSTTPHHNPSTAMRGKVELD